MRRFDRLVLLSTFLVVLESPASALATAPPERSMLFAQSLSWSDIFLPPPDPPAPEEPTGSRGDVCPMAPGLIGRAEVWSDRPLFVWMGRLTQVAVYPQGSSRPLWNQSLSPDAISLAYAGTPLQAGQHYEWSGFDRTGRPIVFDLPSGTDYRIAFSLLADEERDRITADLNAIEARLRATGATAEEIALHKTDYFADRQLWSDALQQALSVESPSAELTQAIDDFLDRATTQYCG